MPLTDMAETRTEVTISTLCAKVVELEHKITVLEEKLKTAYENLASADLRAGATRAKAIDVANIVEQYAQFLNSKIADKLRSEF